MERHEKETVHSVNRGWLPIVASLRKFSCRIRNFRFLRNGTCAVDDGVIAVLTIVTRVLVRCSFAVETAVDRQSRQPPHCGRKHAARKRLLLLLLLLSRPPLLLLLLLVRPEKAGGGKSTVVPCCGTRIRACTLDGKGAAPARYM